MAKKKAAKTTKAKANKFPPDKTGGAGKKSTKKLLRKYLPGMGF